MCRLRNIAMRDYQESVTTRQTPDKVIPMCRYALQATQKVDIFLYKITKKQKDRVKSIKGGRFTIDTLCILLSLYVGPCLKWHGMSK